MKSLKTLCALIMMALISSGLQADFAHAQSPVASQAQRTAGVQEAVDPATADYKLGVDDRITLNVFGEEDLSKDYLIGPNGSIEVPLIGNVRANGRTVDDLRQEITTRLADGYLRNPSVTVAIATFRPFYILGEVNKPGQYAFRKGLTVMGAVATAEGFTYRAQKKWVIIKRENDTSEHRVEVSPTLQVRPGDTIRVAERYF